MRIVLLVALLAGCKEPKECPPERPADQQIVDKDLITAVCLASLMPANTGTAHSSAAVIETADGKKSPWIVRSFQNTTVAELEKAMQWMKFDNQIITGMFPSIFCKLEGPAYATIRLSSAEGSWIWAGKIGALVKEESKDGLGDDSRDRGIQLVLDALAADKRPKPRLALFHEKKDVRMSGVWGSWEEAFKKLAK